MKRTFFLWLGSVLLTLALTGCNRFVSTSTTTTTTSGTTTTLETTTSVTSTTTTDTLSTTESPTTTAFETSISDLELDLALEWQTDETWTVTGTAEAGLMDIVIPSTYLGYPVTGIADYAFYGVYFASLVVPDSIIHVGEYAIACLPVESLSLGKGLTSENVEGGNFDGLGSLVVLVIRFEDEVLLREFTNQIQKYGFDGTSLVWVYVNPDNQAFSSVEGVVYDKEMTRLIFYPLDQGLDSFTVPEGVRTIGQGAFIAAFELQTVILPGSLISIEPYAFGSCSNLSTILFPEGLATIGHHAFDGCGSMTELVIPESVAEIGERAFAFCDSLTLFVIVPSQPAEWDPDWNAGGCEVVWGYAPTS